MESHANYMALGRANNAMEKISKLTHFACWDHSITRPIEHSFLNVIDCSPLPPPVAQRQSSNKLPVAFKYRRLVLITFGSYVSEPLLAKATSKIIPIMISFCDQNNYLLVHVTKTSKSYQSGNYYAHSSSEYLDYTTTCMQCDLVIFTGSICLQNICASHGVPMLFVPFLPEQYFWAKNYIDLAQVHYIDPVRLDETLFILKDNEFIIEHIIKKGKASLKLKKPNLPCFADELLKKYLSTAQSD
jgi:hypothetical protein